MRDKIDSLLKKRWDIVWIGAVLGFVYWMWQSFRDAIVLQKTSFIHSFLFPDLISLATRLLVICTFLLLCIHAKYIQEKVLEDRSARNRSAGFWAFFIAAVGFVVLYWIIDSFQDIIAQAKGDIVERVLTPGITVLISRGLSVLFLVILVFLIQYLFITRRKADKALKAAHNQLARSRENLNKIVTYDVDAVFVLNEKKKILFVNPAAEKMLQKTADQLIGESFNYSISAGKMHEIEIVNDQGETINGEVCAVEITWGTEKAVLVSLRDVSERKQVEQIRQNFLSLISHRLKSPIIGIMGAIENMLEGLAGTITEKQREYLLVMKENVTVKYYLIEDLLTALRLEVGGEEVQLEQTVLEDVIDRAIKPYEMAISRKGIKLQKGKTNSKLRVNADPKKLEKVIKNVIHNALKFTSEGHIRIEIQAKGKNALISIEDSGCGMSDATIKTLFQMEKKAQTLPDANIGMGFGLFIAKKFMQLQNGDIEVTSSLGKGTSFKMSIPLHTKKNIG
ncbi:PAS domain S-box protein [bacterium]|nr:PAS domain S-box protein [bacterium]